MRNDLIRQAAPKTGTMVTSGIALFCALFFLGPIFIGLLGLILPSFGFFPALGLHDLSLSPFMEFWHQPQTKKALYSALMIGLLSTILSIIAVFILMAVGLQHKGSYLFRFIRFLIGPLIALPHSTVAIALLLLLAPSGWLFRLISPELTSWSRPPAFGIVPDQTGWLLIAGLMLKEIPFLLFVALAYARRLEFNKWQSLGQSLGYRPLAVWLYIIWPQIYKIMRLPIFAVLAYALSVVDMTLILGPTLPPTLAVVILQGFEDPDLWARLPASAGAVLQILLVGAALIIWRMTELICAYFVRFSRQSGWRLHSLYGLCITPFYVLTSGFAALLLGLFAIILWGFARRWPFSTKFPQSFDWQFWRFDETIISLFGTSLLIAMAASFLSLAICTLWLETKTFTKQQERWIAIILFIPLLVPQISLLFGLQVGLSYGYLDGHISTVIWLHALYILPYSWLVMAPSYQTFDKRYLWLAASLGKGQIKSFIQVRFVMLIYSFASAFIIGVAVSVALYLPTIFAGAGRVNSITVEAVTLAASGSRSPAAVAAILQMALPLSVYVIVKSYLHLRYGRFAALKAGKGR